MKYTRYQYPGDPVETCQEMSRAEFLREYPRRPIQILSGNSWPPTEVVDEIPVAPDSIVCDLCNADIGDTVWMIPGRAICRKCYEETVQPYIVGRPKR